MEYVQSELCGLFFEIWMFYLLKETADFESGVL